MGVNSLPRTVTRQRRGCDLNPGPTAPESSTLTTRLLLGPTTYMQILNLPISLTAKDALRGMRYMFVEQWQRTGVVVVFLDAFALPGPLLGHRTERGRRLFPAPPAAIARARPAGG